MSVALSLSRPRLAIPALAALHLLASSLPAAEPLRVRLNTLGYPPAAAKQASVLGEAGAEFQVSNAATAERVLSGTLSPAHTNADTDESLATADFSAVREPGEYKLEVAGVGPSAPFRVADDIYSEPFLLAMRGMYLLRCGVAVEGKFGDDTFAHAACHLHDAYLDRVGGGHEQRDATGGWHDAGDYNKYVVNAGITVGCMLRAWEDFAPQIEAIELGLPEAHGALPEFLAEVKWETDWLLKMQADDGSVYHKLSTEGYGGMILPDQEPTDRFLAPWGTKATASFVATLSQAARHFRKYDAAYADRLLAAARKSYEFLAAHPEYHAADNEGFFTGSYESNDWPDRLWADAEFWEATGDAAALAALEAHLRSTSDEEPNADENRYRARRANRDRSPAFDVDWDWGNVKNLGLFTYLASQREGRDPALVEAVRSSLIAAADETAARARAHGYARTLGTRYYWGCNGTVARQTMVLEAAARLAGREAYRAVELDALNHLLGRNPYGRSYITGVGFDPPQHPHDRRAGGDQVAAPWPGYLVGGPHPRATNWQDLEEDYRTNEIAINWNGALIYALAAQLR